MDTLENKKLRPSQSRYDYYRCDCIVYEHDERLNNNQWRKSPINEAREEKEKCDDEWNDNRWKVIL